VKLQISTEEENKAATMKRAKLKPTSASLEFRLDEMRKVFASFHGGIFPHSVLSTQQISILAAEKPDSMEQASYKMLLIFNDTLFADTHYSLI